MQPSDFCTGSPSFPTVHLISEWESQHHSLSQLTSKCSARTYRAAVLRDCVPETGVSLCSQILAVSSSENQSFLQLAARLVFVGHGVPAVEGDVLIRLCRQKLEQLQLNGCCVPQLVLVSITELDTEVSLFLLLSLMLLCDRTSYSGSSIHIHSKPDRLAGAGTGFSPPGFLGDVGWTGRDAGLTSFHVTEDPDGIPGTATIWVDPVLTWKGEGLMVWVTH